MIFGSFRFFMNGAQYGERIDGKSYPLYVKPRGDSPFLGDGLYVSFLI